MPVKRRCQVKTTAAAALTSAAAANTTGAAPRRPPDSLVVPGSVEIDALLLDRQRPMVHLCVNGSYVLAEDADEEELHATEEVHADHERRQAEVEGVPHGQLEDEVDHGHEQGDDRQSEAGHGRQPQRHLGVVGDPQHGHIVERVEVVLGDAAAPRRLRIWDLDARIAEVADEAAEVGVRVVDLSELVHHHAVVQTEAGEVADQGDLAEPVDEPVEEVAYEEHRPLLEALLLDADRDLVAGLPLGDEVADHLRRVLQVGDDADHGVAARGQQPVEGRADVTEVPRVDDHLDARVRSADAAQDLDRAIAGGVVDEEVLVRVGLGAAVRLRAWRQALHDTAHLAHDLVDVLLFVEAGSDDTEEWHQSLRCQTARTARSVGTPYNTHSNPSGP